MYVEKKNGMQIGDSTMSLECHVLENSFPINLYIYVIHKRENKGYSLFTEMFNQSSSNRFFLLGLSFVPYLEVLGFLAFLGMFLITLIANLLLIIMVRINPKLQTPMYFFLSNLSIVDIGLSTTVVPKILKNTLFKDTSVSLLECAIQMHFHLAFGAIECLILAIMAYDRFVAICKPMHYNIIMSKKMCISMAAASWIASFINSMIHVIYTFQMSFCHSHHVNHFFCEVPAFLQISCSDTWLHEVAMYISAGSFASLSFFLTLISYMHILPTILKINSSDGRYKALSTCASHIIVVTLYYGTIMLLYLRPHSQSSPDIDNTISILYSAVTPMLNPIIYSVRNKDVKGTIKKNIEDKS
ncbi:olfactory receptor 5AR1-like, partial [Eleutherodactylus coqui]|uniref:olfactory receptor 5AR1-like n=1 Tax=Eleutherodactylus coqui TaxID=57060 RepID=UPI0034629F7E